MQRYYTVNRKISIEPETGVIVNGAEEIWMFYAQDEEEARNREAENQERELAPEAHRDVPAGAVGRKSRRPDGDRQEG